MRDSRFRRQRFNANGLAERIAILLVVAVVAGISIGLLMPKGTTAIHSVSGRPMTMATVAMCTRTCWRAI